MSDMSETGGSRKSKISLTAGIFVATRIVSGMGLFYLAIPLFEE